MPNEQFPFSISKELKERLRRFANKHGISMAQAIRDAIKRHIK